jgi:hypothetical protein
MIRRFLVALVVALLLQATAFAIYYDDLLFLRRPLPEIVGGSKETFAGHAGTALGRNRLTVRHLDVIAAAAEAFGLIDLEVAALERRVLATPSDDAARLRLADTLRRAKRFAEAESIFLDILSSSDRAHP